MKRCTFESTNEADTATLGAALATVLPAGTTVALNGTLGAGKTRLVQAIADSLGVDRRSVVSPTFVLIQEYSGRRAIYHIDAYRIRDEDDFLQLGVDEYFDGLGLVLIEWADRIEGCLPRERVEIAVSVSGPQSRQFRISALGPRYEGMMDRLARVLQISLE